jgi:hypothetical protein
MGDHNVVGAVVFALSINATVHQLADQVAGAGCSGPERRSRRCTLPAATACPGSGQINVFCPNLGGCARYDNAR